ncbi:FecCD family ABC transporter permease [Solibacillus sp. FSL K6-1523]|uniref:FecCD family ABC transporter permease n=1 Tax=Solibacillus sp. FSL K6-1523 TaxID=2921471 RepID=UPI0030F5B1DC
MSKQGNLSSPKSWFVLFLLIILLALAVCYASLSGSANIPIKQLIGLEPMTDEINRYIIKEIRMPRILLAIITGMSLAVAGVVMQVLLKNPLASPFTLGVSSGASFGAALAIVLGTSIFGMDLVASGKWLIAFNAFFFGCISVFIVYGIATIKNGSTTVLLLAGVAIGNLFSAGVSAMKYFSDNEALKNLVIWLMGGFWGASWEVVYILVPLLTIGLLILLRLSWSFNSLNAGDEVAKTLGVNVKVLKICSLLLVTLLASSSIAFVGIIGFIGLVAPHIGRMLVGVDYRFLIPISSLLGALILLVSDTVARTILAPIEIPVGIITSCIGAPFFIYILLQKKKDYWG